MNIFELVVSDPVGYEQAGNEFTQHNGNWMEFRKNMKAIFSN